MESIDGFWSKDYYLSDADAMFNRTIVEYDLKSANTSLAREYKLLPEEKIKEIESLPKKERVVAIGLYKRDHPEYSEVEKLAFAHARRSFMTMNDLDEADIHSVKRDAIFCLRYVRNEQVGDHLIFRPKNEYTSYIHLRPFELYYNSKNGLDIKGMDDEVYTTRHEDYFGKFLCSMIRRQETGNDVLKYIRKFWDKYKWRQLETDYYREFNAQSQYLYKDGLRSMEEYRGDINELDISYNSQLISRLASMMISYA